ncbi:class I SAM-dependent methyltransferase [Desulfovibrio sp. UCD-KL4C]|uniref:class I SAM-dependent methyltransferase n=1 Tax=Desulfovibrio sp. UCD-KL4C TaxID=2578120 RepID=UPI0025C3121B|nr:class I SAM-dependent methyltransferase [Desulfovibrio sp. UCD-KL4C]
MKTEWDYTKLADAYLKRPEYAPELLDKLFDIAEISKNSKVCDIGAGAAHLTIPMVLKGFSVDAVEPNDAMRANGIKRTAHFDNVSWFEGTGENTGRPFGEYDFVSFGSSFNVCDRSLAMKEIVRLLKSNKWFTCMWNHRQLDDPIQQEIENIIKKYIQDYGYGTRRENQTKVIEESGLFSNITEETGIIVHTQQIVDVVEAWRSHGTLHRQAGDSFHKIIEDIEKYLVSLKTESIQVPYMTRAWIAQKKD